MLAQSRIRVEALQFKGGNTQTAAELVGEGWGEGDKYYSQTALTHNEVMGEYQSLEGVF